MRNSPCPICKNPIKDLLILEVDENVKTINIDDNFLVEKKDEIIDVNEGDNNKNNNGENNENINNENNINIENNNILNNNNQNNIEDEEKEKINQENQ
jgi:hypothetical protein